MLLHYRSYTPCGGKKRYEAFQVDSCLGTENPVELTSPTIQAVVAFAKKYGLTLKREN